MINDKTFMIAGLIIAIVIGSLAVFLASGDELHRTGSLFFVQGDKTLTGPSPEDGDPEAIGAGTFEYEAPLPDYSTGEEGGKAGEIIAVFAGIIIMFILGFGTSKLIASKKKAA